MPRKHKALKEWVAAGLIAEDQARAIEHFEETRRKGHFGRGLVGLSLLAILVGVLSIIAANWYAIPGSVKIGAHVLLNLFVGFVAWKADRKGNALWREGAALAFFGLTMTLIILIGQVYQLDGQASDAFLLWMIVTLPFFLLLGNSYMTAVPWMAAFLATVGLVLAEKLDGLDPEHQRLFVFGTAALLPLALMADGSIAMFQRWKPALADVSLKCGAVISAGLASMALILWQGPQSFYRAGDIIEPVYAWTVLAFGFAGIAAHAFVHGFYKNDDRMQHGSLFAAVSLLCFVLPLPLMSYGNGIFAAITFIAYWIFIGWTGQSLGRLRLVSLAITLIAIRIFVIYVELFGTLIDTGFGLISGGVVMLALIYGARKLNTRITKKQVAA